MTEITPTELHTLLSGDAPPVVLDVREPWETQICMIPGSLQIPMGSLPHRLQDIPGDRVVAVVCHHGVRSAMAASFLADEGLQAVNVSGGIDEWARAIDREMARY